MRFLNRKMLLVGFAVLLVFAFTACNPWGGEDLDSGEGTLPPEVSSDFGNESSIDYDTQDIGTVPDTSPLADGETLPEADYGLEPDLGDDYDFTLGDIDLDFDEQPGGVGGVDDSGDTTDTSEVAVIDTDEVAVITTEDTAVIDTDSNTEEVDFGNPDVETGTEDGVVGGVTNELVDGGVGGAENTEVTEEEGVVEVESPDTSDPAQKGDIAWFLPLFLAAALALIYAYRSYSHGKREKLD